MINPELKKGDRVKLLQMEDQYSPVMPGTWGTVTSKSVVFGEVQYSVTWDNGTKDSVGNEIVSRHNLLADLDLWTKEENFKKRVSENKVIHKKNLIKETSDMDKEWERGLSIIQNKEVLKYFDMKFFKEYLDTLRETGIVNMFGASPYLFMGRDRIKHEFTYKDIPNEDAFDKLLDMADESQSKMIHGVIELLENEGRDAELSVINNKLNRYSTKILQMWVILYYH